MLINDIIDDSFRGSILISKGDEIIYQSSTGFADLANEIPNITDTKFATASAGKVFVAVGVLQLVQKGLLKLDDEIGNILKLDLNKIDHSITIAQLLSHTSGIPDYFDETIMNEYEELWADFPNYKIRSNKDLLPLFINKPMMYLKGTKFQYNNTGFVVLAMIIEEITTQSFDDYLRVNIFEPCGMINTGYYELDILPAKCANNYIYNEARMQYRTNIYSVDAKGTGAGGAFTTVNDIKLFWNQLISNQLLSQEMTNTMLSNHSGDENCYGYGIWLKAFNGATYPYFQGSDPGVSFISSYNLETNTIITLVSNYGDNVLD